MSKHWRPDGKIVEGPWTRSQAYGAPPRGSSCAVTLLLGAMFVGGIAGLAWQRWPTPAEQAATSAIEWNAVQAVPRGAADAEDVAWEQRAAEQDSPSTGSGRTVYGAIGGSGLPRTSGARNSAASAAFGYCKWGGGTNCVVDGDTFYVGGEKVRIAGIDAPETHDYGCQSELALGDRATEKLHALLNSGVMTMTSIDRNRDRYGRLLRNVAVGGQDVGEAMISAGVAREYGRGRRPWC